MAVLHLGADGRLRHPDGSLFDAKTDEGRALVEEARAIRAKFDAAMIAARERGKNRAAMLAARHARREAEAALKRSLARAKARLARKVNGGDARPSSGAVPPPLNSGAR